MAEPKLEIEKRLDRIELAIGTMAAWLVQAQTGFSQKDAQGIGEILYGKPGEKRDDASQEPEAESMGVREQGSSVGESSPLQHQGETSEDEPQG